MFIEHYYNKDKITNSLELYNKFKALGYKSRYYGFC